MLARLARLAHVVVVRRLGFDDALRMFLASFKLPGEAQKIDRFMEVTESDAHKPTTHAPPRRFLLSVARREGPGLGGGHAVRRSLALRRLAMTLCTAAVRGRLPGCAPSHHPRVGLQRRVQLREPGGVRARRHALHVRLRLPRLCARPSRGPRPHIAARPFGMPLARSSLRACPDTMPLQSLRPALLRCRPTPAARRLSAAGRVMAGWRSR